MLDFIKLDNTDDPDDLLKLLEPWALSEQKRYQPKHCEWEKNALFYLGKHWIEKKSGVDGYIIYEDDAEHFYPVTNYAKLLINFKINQFAGKRPVAVVKPVSINPDDVYNSRLGHLSLKAKYKIDSESVNDRLVLLHSTLFGVGWRVDYKEPIPEKYLEVPQFIKKDNSRYSCTNLECGYSDRESPVCPMCGSEAEFTHEVVEEAMVDPMTGQPVIDRFPMYKSCSEVVDPFRILTSQTLTPKGRKYIIDVSMQPVRWIKDYFGRQEEGYTGLVDKVRKSASVPRSIRFSEDLKAVFAQKHSGLYNTVSSDSSQFKNEEDSSLFYKVYFQPSKKYPRGRCVIFTPDVVLYSGVPDVPMKNKRYKWWHPYTEFIWEMHPMNSEGVSLIGDLIPINKQINSLDAIFLEHADRTASPQRVEFEDVIVNNNDETEGALRIQGKPGLPNGGAPFYLQVNQIANELYRMRADKVTEMEKLAKVPAVVQGLHTTNVDTFRGMKLLRETAESSESDVWNRYYEYVENYNKLKLCLIQECLVTRDEDLIALMHTLNENEGNSKDEIENFIGADMSDQWNIEVTETDYVSNTKAAEQETVKDAIMSKIISEEEMMEPTMKFNILEKMGLGGIVETFGYDDIKKGLWIIQLLEGKKFDKVKAAIKEFDNKNLQLKVLLSWMKKPRFYDLDPEVQVAAEALIKDLGDAVFSAPTQSAGEQPSLAGESVQPPTASPSAITA